MKTLPSALVLCSLLAACDSGQMQDEPKTATSPATSSSNVTLLQTSLSQSDAYANVDLKADLAHLSDAHKTMLGMLIDAAEIMNDLFWKQAFGDKDSLLNRIKDPELKHLAELHYGPWDRLNNNEPFIKEYGRKNPGANFYPANMSKQEFEAAELLHKTNPYSLVRRDHTGKLMLIPYSEAYADELARAAALLKNAAELSEDQGFKNYLLLRAQALLTDNYQASDSAWLDMKTNPIELIIGPIETYEDQLFGYRAAYEAFVLIKDPLWSERLSRFAQYLPELQKNLPVDAAYKKEQPGSSVDLNAYDAVYYAGDSNSLPKTIAINLPNDETLQLEKGTRRLQLKNAMRAKFEKIMLPIAEQLIDPTQRKHLNFDAFFANTLFHEIAHGLGIKNTINNKGTARAALEETYSSLEEGKADILGLYMLNELYRKGELTETNIVDNYITFLTGIFRSVRFGASSAHGSANMISFNFFQEHEGFHRNETTGYYRVNPDKMQAAIAALANLLLTTQGNGDYNAAKLLIANKGAIGAELEKDLQRLTRANIPVDITFNQGKKILGLTSP